MSVWHVSLFARFLLGSVLHSLQLVAVSLSVILFHFCMDVCQRLIVFSKYVSAATLVHYYNVEVEGVTDDQTTRLVLKESHKIVDCPVCSVFEGLTNFVRK